MNHVELTACIAEASALRYTPAGITVANFVLEHESEVVHAGVARQVKLTLRAVAFAALAEQSSQLPLGKLHRFTGFLSNARSSKSLVFNLHAIDPLTR